MVGISGIAGDRCMVVTARGRNRPLLTNGRVAAKLPNIRCVSPVTKALSAGTLPLYGTWTMPMPAASLNMTPARWGGVPFPGETGRRSVSWRPVVQLPRTRFCERDEILYGTRRQRRVHHQDIGKGRKSGDRCEILYRIIGQLRLHVGVDRMRSVISLEYGVPVGCGARGELGAHDRSSPRPIINHEPNTRGFCNLLGDRAGYQVCAAAGWEGNNIANWVGRVRLSMDRRACLRQHHECQGYSLTASSEHVSHPLFCEIRPAARKTRCPCRRKNRIHSLYTAYN